MEIFMNDDFYKSFEEICTFCRVPITIVDASGAPLKIMPDDREDLVPRQAVRWTIDDFFAQDGDTAYPLITYLEPGYFLAVFSLPQDRFCIVGLVSPFQHPRSEILQIASEAFVPEKLQEFCRIMMQMPTLTLTQFRSLLCLLVRLSRGEEIEAGQIRFVNKTVSRGKDIGESLFMIRENADFHVPIDYEIGLCEAVTAGDQALLLKRLKSPSQGKIGQCSANPLRQVKYSFISLATLLTRAAIKGGLPDEDAFNLSDLYCQNMDVLTEPASVEHLVFTMAQDFCRHVADTKAKDAQSPAVRECINYISAHLHEDLGMEIMAKHCGLCTRSLSLKFKKEMGMGIPEYIHREKIKEARYLLRNSDYSLADIALFLHYPTQSYFTQIFKKYEGCTPQQYRDHS